MRDMRTEDLDRNALVLKGRHRVLDLAESLDDRWIEEEIRMHRRLCLGLGGLVLLVLALGAQSAPNIRKPDIDSESPDGALITQAAMVETAEEKIECVSRMLFYFSTKPYSVPIRSNRHDETIQTMVTS